MIPDIAVAIDFGTTRSAWAYKVAGEAGDTIMVRTPEDVRTSGSSTEKTESVVLMGNRGRGDFIAFGNAAREQFSGAVGDNSLGDKALFQWFKRGLGRDEGFKSIVSECVVAAH